MARWWLPVSLITKPKIRPHMVALSVTSINVKLLLLPTWSWTFLVYSLDFCLLVCSWHTYKPFQKNLFIDFRLFPRVWSVKPFQKTYLDLGPDDVSFKTLALFLPFLFYLRSVLHFGPPYNLSKIRVHLTFWYIWNRLLQSQPFKHWYPFLLLFVKPDHFGNKCRLLADNLHSFKLSCRKHDTMSPYHLVDCCMCAF